MTARVVSLFAGIGGFDLAFERAGATIVYANEWDHYASIAYDRHFRIPCDIRSIKTVQALEIPDHDILVGGFPCQAFSVAGKRKGFDDTRGTLFFDIARILDYKRPRYFLLENVKGLLSHERGKTFSTILRVLSELGYELQWEVLNSKHFGVPQNRERVFIVGHLRGKSRPEVFPIRKSNEPIESSTCLDANYWKGADKHGQRTLIEITENVRDAERIYDPMGIAKTLKGLGGGMGAKTGLYAIQDVRGMAKKQNGKGWKEANESYTVDTLATQGVTDTRKVRRLTPTECERLQGFPDGWTEGASDSQRYKMLGNAVTVNVVYEIAKKMLLAEF